MSRREPPQHLSILVNPASGRGRGAVALESTLSLLRRRGLEPTLYRTSGPGDAVQRARAAVQSGTDLMLVIGGDGTVRDAVEGIGEADVPVGILPFGTGNDLCRTLGVPKDLEPALEVALEGEERRLDVWLWGELPFVNIAGVGLDAAVAGMVNRKFRRLRGTLAYLAAFVQVLPRFQPFPVDLSWPGGGWSGRAWLVAAANARSYGGGMFIAPAADPDDGLLDVIVVEDLPKLALLQQFPNIFRGTHVRHPAVHTFLAERLRVGADPQEVTVDGELIGQTPATVLRAPYRQRVRVP